MRLCRHKRNAAIYLGKEIHDFLVSVWQKLMAIGIILVFIFKKISKRKVKKTEQKCA